jgi:hypothetical protein
MDILQDIVDWGRDKELEGSKVVVTPVKSGDTLQEVAPILPLEAQGGWEQECSISIKDTEGVGSTENKDKGRDNRVRDNKDKDSMVKDWGLQSETGRGLGEGEEGGKKGIERGGEKIKVVKRGNLERIQRSKVRLGVEERLEVIGRSKEMT